VVCTVTIGSQPVPLTITDKTEVMPTDITVDLGGNEVESTTSGGFFNCGVPNGEHSEGEMATFYTLRGYNKANEQIDLEVSG
jgi:hypothetical protein